MLKSDDPRDVSSIFVIVKTANRRFVPFFQTCPGGKFDAREDLSGRTEKEAFENTRQAFEGDGCFARRTGAPILTDPGMLCPRRVRQEAWSKFKNGCLGNEMRVSISRLLKCLGFVAQVAERPSYQEIGMFYAVSSISSGFGNVAKWEDGYRLWYPREDNGLLFSIDSENRLQIILKKERARSSLWRSFCEALSPSYYTNKPKGQLMTERREIECLAKRLSGLSPSSRLGQNPSGVLLEIGAIYAFNYFSRTHRDFMPDAWERQYYE